jgi:hypothetical protein
MSAYLIVIAAFLRHIPATPRLSKAVSRMHLGLIVEAAANVTST